MSAAEPSPVLLAGSRPWPSQRHVWARRRQVEQLTAERDQHPVRSQVWHDRHGELVFAQRALAALESSW